MSGIAITFPLSPTEGQSYLAQNGFTYIYDSNKNRWKRGGEFVRAPKVLSYAGVAVTTTGSGITTGPTGALIYNVPGFVVPNSEVGVDSYKAYRAAESYPNYTEFQVSISSDFSSVAYAATFTGTTHTLSPGTLSGDTTYYVRARQFVGSDASSAGVGAISGYSPNVVSFATTSTYIDTPVIVSIAGTTSFPVYQIGYASTTLPATVEYTGSGVNELERVDWRVTGPRIPTSTGDTALAEIGIGTHSSATLANALVLALPFSGATGVGITDDVNNAIRTASSASAGTTKTLTANGDASIATITGLALTSHFYDGAAYFDGTGDYLSTPASTDYQLTGDFTLEHWIHLSSYSNNTTIDQWTGSSTGQGNYQIYLRDTDNGKVDFYYDGNSKFQSSQAVPLNTWTHIAVVRSGSTISMFFNGIRDNKTITFSGTVGRNDTLWIGAQHASGPVNYLNGYLQDLKIYKGLAKYTENFTPPLPTYGTISYTTGTTYTGINTTAYYQSTGDVGIAETSSTAANALVLALPMNKTFGFQDINVSIRGLTSGASAGTAKTVGLGTTSTANAPTHPIISSTESKWYDGAAYFDGGDYLTLPMSSAPTGTNNFTIEYWINHTTTRNYDGGLWGRRFSAGDNLQIYWGYPTSGYNLLLNDTSLVGETYTNPANTWEHYAWVRNGNTFSLYRNGVLISTNTNSSSVTKAYAHMKLGWADFSNHFDGHLQDFKVYDGVAKYTESFAPPQPICGFSTDISTQTGFTTTTASGALLSSVVGLGSTSTLAFDADTTYAGITSITSSSGITTLTDPYAQNLVLALPLSDITGVGNSFTNDRNTQIRSVSLVGGGTTKTVTNTGVSTVAMGSTSKWYGNTAYFDGADYLTLTSGDNFYFGTNDFTIESWVNYSTSGTLYSTSSNQGDWKDIGTGYFNLNASGLVNYINTSNSQSDFTPITTTPTNQWCHLAFVKSGNTLTCYLNGIFNGQATNVNSILGNSSSGVPAISKWDSNSGGRGYVVGYLQDYRIYNGTAKYTTNFTPPPPMFGDYVRDSNKIVFTPASDYVLEAKNTSGSFASSYSATRQWGTKPEGGIYDPYAGNLVLAIPGGAQGGITTAFDVTGQIKLETPTSTYSSGQTVTSPSGSTYINKTVTNNGVVNSASQYEYYGRSLYFDGATNTRIYADGFTGYDWTQPFTVEFWVYFVAYTTSTYCTFFGNERAGVSGTFGISRSSNNLYGGSLNGGALNANQWYHVAYSQTYDGQLLFKDGVLVASSSSKLGSVPDYQYVISGARIVSDAFTGRAQFYLQDLRMYSNFAKYTSDFTPPNQIYLT